METKSPLRVRIAILQDLVRPATLWSGRELCLKHGMSWAVLQGHLSELKKLGLRVESHLLGPGSWRYRAANPGGCGRVLDELIEIDRAAERSARERQSLVGQVS
jgi:hypothetical protein